MFKNNDIIKMMKTPQVIWFLIRFYLKMHTTINKISELKNISKIIQILYHHFIIIFLD